MMLGAIIASVATRRRCMERFAYRPLRNAPGWHRSSPPSASRSSSRSRRLFYPGRQEQAAVPADRGGHRSGDHIGGADHPAGRDLHGRLALIICAALLWYFVNRTRLGRGMQAVSQDPDTARLMGINVDRIIVVAFILGAVLAAVAGVARACRTRTSTSAWASSPA